MAFCLFVCFGVLPYIFYLTFSRHVQPLKGRLMTKNIRGLGVLSQ